MARIKLNLGGCETREDGVGSIPLEGFINVDIRPQKGVDVVCDIRGLFRWKDNSVEEIRASHIIEHFTVEEIPIILKEWHRVLMPGGLLRVYCPDANKIIESYTNGNIDMRKFSAFLFGRQTYEGNLHKIALDRHRLDNFIEEAGFKIIGHKQRPRAYPYDLGVQAVKI